MAYELLIGYRYLKSEGKKGFISLITLLAISGIAVGVMTLIVVIAVMTGAEVEFKSQVLGAQPHILVMHTNGPLSNFQHCLETARSIKGVKSALPFVHTRIVLRSSRGLTGVILKGIPPGPSNHLLMGKEQLVKGSDVFPGPATSKENYLPGIIIGKALANELSVSPGDQVIYMIFPDKFSMARLPATKRFKVIGIFKSGMDEYDKTYAYTSIGNAEKIMNMGNAITGIQIKLKDPDQAKNVSKKLLNKLGMSFWVTNWMQMNRNIFSALKLQKTIMFIILILIVLVAAFNIAGSLFMMVIERTKDIAILKAMGATKKSIRKIFIFKGMVIGLMGTGLGIILGSTICFILTKYQFISLPGDVYYFTSLPIRLEALDVLIISFSAMVICFFATLYPANLASGLTPVSGIRT